MNKMYNMLIILAMFLVSMMTVKAQFNPIGCQNDPSCPTATSSLCQCQSTLNGEVCYLIPCYHDAISGCNQLNFAYKITCPDKCVMTGTYTGACAYESGCPSTSCTIGQTKCVGSPIDVETGKSKGWTTCIAGSNGCGVWSASITTCPIYCQQFDSQTAGCSVYPVKSCQSTCSPPQTKCFTDISGLQYSETCGNWKNDGCYYFPTDIVPANTLPNYGTSYCPYGCNQVSSDNAVCNIKPNVCTSTCQLGDTMCGANANVLFKCQLKKYNSDGTPCYDWFDVNGNSNQTISCPYGCTETTKNQATCNLANQPIPQFNLTSGTFNCTPPSCGYPSHNGGYGIAKIGQYLYGIIIDPNYYNKAFTYFANNLSYVGMTTLPKCDVSNNGYEYIAGDGSNLYVLWYDSSGHSIIQQVTPSVCGNIVLNTSIQINQFDVSNSYIYAVTPFYYEGNIYRFDKNGNLLNSFTDNSWKGTPSGICGSDGFVWITDTGNDRVLQYSPSGVFSGYILQNHSWSSCDIDIQNQQIYALDFSNGIWGWNYLQRYDYGNVIPNPCTQGSKECVGELLFNGHWVQPYLVQCSLINGYWQYPTDNSSGNAQSCQYGCEFNASLGDVACRNSPPTNCTSEDWKCTPYTTGCDGNYEWTCKDTYNNNCFAKVNTVPCVNGCGLNGQCKACQNECSPNESMCYNNGYEDWYKQQSVQIATPVISQCDYDYNQGCWVWSTQNLERCPYGCFENTTNGTRNGYCYSNNTLNNYMIPQFTQAMGDLFNTGGTLLTALFPSDGLRYMFSFVITVMIVGFIIWKGHDINPQGNYLAIGLATFILLTLGFSLFGWLPIWLSIVYIAIGGLYLMNKIFWSKGGEE
jgi:hypothetical protein